MNKAICILTNEENEEIKELYEKKLALENIINIIDPENDILRLKFEKDYGIVVYEFQHWWDKTSTKYAWEKGDNWSINFDTKEVFMHWREA